MKPFRMLLQEKQYSRLFWAGLISGLGDRFNQVAVLSLLLSLTGSGYAVGIAFGVRLLPFLLFGPVGGVLADRFSRKRIMIVTDLARAVFALLPMLVRDSSGIWILYAAAFLLAAGEALFASARMSAIPQLVHPNNLLAVNGLDEAMTGIVLIGGSITGGVVSAAAGTQAAFVANAVSYLLSALLLVRIRLGDRSRQEPVKAENPGAGRIPTKDNADPSAGLSGTGTPLEELRSVLAGSPFMKAMLIVFALWPVGGGIFNILLSVYAVNVFHKGDIGIGLFYGALGVGMLLGSSCAGRFAQHMKAAAVLALLLEGVLHMLISQTGYFAAALLLLTVTACCGAIGSACSRTILMDAVPRRIQGRFFGYLATLQNTLLGIVMFMAGLSLEWAEPRLLGLAGGSMLALAGGVFALVFYVRRSRFG